MDKNVNNTEQKFGLFGCIAFVVGNVIGAGIFVMSGSLAGDLGPGMFICYIIGLIPALGMGLSYAQLGSAIPVTSGMYSYISMFIHPAAGFLFNWASLLAGCSICATVCQGVGTYIGVYFPAIPTPVFTIGALAIFTVLNIMGVKSVEKIQNMMVVFLVVALVGFIIVGLPNMNPELSKPLFPNGTGGLMMGALSLFFSYLGFQIIADLGQEVKNPGKNIPLSICIGAAIVGVIYIGVAFVMPRIIPYTELASGTVSLVDVANEISPAFGVIIWIAAVFAIFSSINGCLAQGARCFFVMGRDGWLPNFFSNKNSKEVPVGSLIIMFIITALILATNWELAATASLGSIAMFLGTAMIAWFPLLIKKKYPDAYEGSQFKLPLPIKILIAIITCGISLLFLVISIGGFVDVWVLAVAWMIPGVIIYIIGKKKGIKEIVN